MTDKFFVENDYTLSAVRETETMRKSENTEDRIVYVSSLTRTFNFMSAQVTTIKCDRMCQSRGTESGGSAAVSTQMVIENFNDIQLTAEIELMHEKLVEMGGKPPAIVDILGRLNKNRLG